MNLKIREAMSNDYNQICNLNIEVHNLHVKNRPDVYVDINNPLSKENFDDLLNTDNTKVFVVENLDNTELAGYSVVKIMDMQSISILVQNKFAFIDNFCVRSDYKRNGIGKLLFEYAVGYAKSQGATSLQLGVWEFNEDAINFYEKMGMSTRNRRMELNI